MKKFSILLLGALAMAAVSCDDNAPEMPPMQSNPQEPIFVDGDVKVEAAGVTTSTQPLTLEDYTESAKIEVMKVTDMILPEGASLVCVFQLSSVSDFAKGKVVDVSTSISDGVVTVNANDWNAAHIDLFGKSPKEKTAYWRIPVYVDLGGSAYRYMGPDWYGAEGTIKETCMDAGFVIYSEYYFFSNSTTWEMDKVKDYKFSHSDKDVYDDPVFTYVVTVNQAEIDANGGGSWWKIGSSVAVDTQDWNLLYGPEENGDENFSGILVGDGKAQSGKLTEPGKYRFTINMEEMTYEIEQLTRPDFVAVPSNANGWNQGGPRLYYTNDDSKPWFVGAARVNNNDGGFKFIWDDTWYGGANGVIDAAGGNIPAPEDATALYWFTVNTYAMTYTITPITSLGVIGGGDWNNQKNLTPSDDQLTWEGDVQISGEWKIRMNETWDMNYGGDMDAAEFNGGNFAGLEGTYHVTVDFSGNRPKVTAVAK